MDPVALASQLVELVLKGGVTGLLILIIVVGGRYGMAEMKRLRTVCERTFAQRDRARLALTMVRTAADAAGVKYDLRQVDELLKDDDVAPA